MRGIRPLLAMGLMSLQFKALAASQDLIGWREFMEGHVSVHFHAIQSFHLAMSTSYLNGKDRTKLLDFLEHHTPGQNTWLPLQ